MGIRTRFKPNGEPAGTARISQYDIIKQVQQQLPLLNAIQSNLNTMTDRYLGESHVAPTVRHKRK